MFWGYPLGRSKWWSSLIIPSPPSPCLFPISIVQKPSLFENRVSVSLFEEKKKHIPPPSPLWRRCCHCRSLAFFSLHTFFSVTHTQKNNNNKKKKENLWEKFSSCFVLYVWWKRSASFIIMNKKSRLIANGKLKTKQEPISIFLSLHLHIYYIFSDNPSHSSASLGCFLFTFQVRWTVVRMSLSSFSFHSLPALACDAAFYSFTINNIIFHSPIHLLTLVTVIFTYYCIGGSYWLTDCFPHSISSWTVS